jgi:hypothetical protein
MQQTTHVDKTTKIDGASEIFTVDEATVSLERLHEGRIVVFTIKGASTRPVVDKWFDVVAGVVTSWPAEKPYLALHDLTDKRVTLTPYARGRVREFDDLVRRLHGRIAIALPNTFMGHMIRLFLATVRWQQALPTEGFLSKEAALRWLEKALPENHSSKG